MSTILAPADYMAKLEKVDVGLAADLTSDCMKAARDSLTTRQDMSELLMELRGLSETDTLYAIDDDTQLRSLVEEAISNMLMYLELCGRRRGYRPSRFVDFFWHQFRLHETAYAAYCERFCGKMIRHEPRRTGDPEVPAGSSLLTFEVIKMLGFRPNEAMWQTSSRCDADGGGGGCGDDVRQLRGA